MEGCATKGKKFKGNYEAKLELLYQKDRGWAFRKNPSVGYECFLELHVLEFINKSDMLS